MNVFFVINYKEYFQIFELTSVKKSNLKKFVERVCFNFLD